MNIDELQARRELDALVAKRVMSWLLSPDNYEWLDEDGKQVASAKYIKIGGNDDILPWSPSTDIAAAWQVVEKCKLFNLWRSLRKDTQDNWVVVDDPPRVVQVIGCGDTAPLAICRAALRIVQK